MRPIQTILVPIEFGAPSEHALAFAVDLAESLHATIHVVSTFELPIVPFPDGVLIGPADIASSVIAETQQTVERACEKYKDRSVSMSRHVERGDAKKAILDVAEKVHADLIIMGTHARKGIARALLGSVAESVVRFAEVPVLTVH